LHHANSSIMDCTVK